ncbi:hypothetical protein J6590_084346 [Homalodisca vitripennis]|nr:hypothetical protein J6590_084346 [Homalodisca vitripennis]
MQRVCSWHRIHLSTLYPERSGSKCVISNDRVTLCTPSVKPHNYLKYAKDWSGELPYGFRMKRRLPDSSTVFRICCSWTRSSTIRIPSYQLEETETNCNMVLAPVHELENNCIIQ